MVQLRQVKTGFETGYLTAGLEITHSGDSQRKLAHWMQCGGTPVKELLDEFRNG